MALVASVWIFAFAGNAQVIISEFMADNASNKADNFGEYSDWIEICNISATNVNLLNWGLTDNSNDSTPWLFPSTNLASGATMLLFASGRDIRVAGGTLHTDFALKASGEYLGLRRPDGTIACEFAPQFPAQIANVSYGFGRKLATTSLFNTNWQGKVRVPLDGALGTSWTDPQFNDTAWANATNGIGFERAGGASTNVPADVLADNPLAYWRLNEQGTNGGAVNAGSLGSAAQGFYASGATNSYVSMRPTNGFPGFETTNTAAHFNGSSSVMVPYQSALNPAGSFTVEAWAKPASTSLSTVVSSLDRIQNGNNSRMGYVIYSSGTWEFNIGDYNGYVAKVTAGSPVAGKWTHLVGVYDSVSSAASFYADGVLLGIVGTSRPYAPNTNTAAPFRIGLNSNLSYPFSGDVDEVAFFNRALTGTEISQRFEAATASGTNYFAGLYKTDIATSMLNSNSSVYLRLPFTLSSTNDVSQMHLRARYNDGFIAYLNGTELARDNAPLVPDWNSAAETQRAVADSTQWVDFTVSDYVGNLRAGTNVLALQGLNATATNSNFLLSSELEIASSGVWQTNAGYFFTPTPGAVNAESVENPGPLLSQAAHSPNVPVTATSITVTCRVAQALSPVSSVTLNWRVMYEAASRTLAMYDDGAHDDGAAGDGVYGAIIPYQTGGVTNFTSGQMVRWYITATDTASRASRLPVYLAGMATEEYFGTVFDPGFTGSTLPVIWLYASNYVNGVGVDASSKAGGRLSVYYDGEFYDNVFMNARGNSTIGYLKKSHSIEFNSGHKFRHPGPGGKRLGKTSFTADYPDPTYLRQRLTFWLCEQMGAPGPFYHPVRLQMNGDFYQLANHNDLHGEELLDRLGYDPDGALYNAAGCVSAPIISTGGFDKKTRQWDTSNSDYYALAAGISITNSAGRRMTNIFDMLDLPQVIDYMAVARFTHENDDVWANMSVYHDNDGDNLWRIIPFDMNLSWGAAFVDVDALKGIQATNDTLKSHPLYGSSLTPVQTGANWNRMYDAIFQVPQTREMFLRRLRTLLDTWVKPPGTATNLLPLEPMLRQWRDEIAVEATLDRNKWGWPAQSGQCNFVPGINLSNGVETLINEFLGARRQHFYGKHSVTNTALPIGLTKSDNAGIPLAQPTNAVISIAGWDYNPVSGIQEQEYICLTNANNFAVDISGWKIKGGISHTFQPGTVIPSGMALYLTPNVVAFKARTVGPRGGMGLFVQGGYSGQLSARGDTFTLVDTQGVTNAVVSYPGTPSLAQQYLRITEIMYNPAGAPAINSDAQQFEYIEIKNTSDVTTLSLSNVSLVNGILFTFPTNATLAPGARSLLVRNLAAFTALCGGSLPISGVYTGALNNAGENIRLEDAMHEKVLDFSYNNTWYPVTDGGGFSLVIVDENADWSTWGDKSSWRPSAANGGSPALSDPAPPAYPLVRINEVLSHSDPPYEDMIELVNLSSTNVNIGGWFITDDPQTPRKYRIADGAILLTNGFQVFTASQFGSGSNAFLFSEYGEQACLFGANSTGDLTGFYQSVEFDASPVNVSFGRYVTSEGKERFVIQRGMTLGQTNAGPQVGPVVISEVMYNPPVGQEEFVELENIASTNVALYCIHTNEPGYGLNALTNTWRLRKGVDYDFPQAQILAAGQRLLVVGFDPSTNAAQTAAFRSAYGVPGAVAIYGPYSGKLNNSGESVELLAPDKPDITPTNFVMPYVTQDKLNYDRVTPWPVEADGWGSSLQRLDSSAYGNDPINWMAAAPTPGLANAIARPVILSFTAGISQTSLSVSAVAGRSYTLEYKDTLSDSWTAITPPFVADTNTVTLTHNAAVTTNRFYRVRAQ